MERLPDDIVVELVVGHQAWNLLAALSDLVVVYKVYDLEPTKTIETLIVHGALHTFEQVRQRAGLPYTPTMIEAAIQSNKPEVMDYFLHRDQIPPPNAMELMAKYNSGRLYHWLHERGYRATEKTVAAAAAEGHLELLTSLIQHGVAPDESSLIHAAGNGHLNVVEFLIAIGVPGLEDAVDSAAAGGHLSVVKYLQTAGVRLLPDTIYTAVCHGQLTMVKYLYDMGCPLTDDMLQIASDSGYTELAEYLAHRLGRPVPPKSTSSTTAIPSTDDAADVTVVNEYVAAVAQGRLDLVRQWFTEHRRYDHEAIETAARCGHVLLVKFFLDAGVSASRDCFDAAVERGHLSVVELLHAGHQTDDRLVSLKSLINATLNGHLSVVRYLLNRGYSIPRHTVDELVNDGLYYAVIVAVFSHARNNAVPRYSVAV